MWRWMLAGVIAVQAAAQTEADPAAARRIFEAQCALCHGQTGGGGRGPALNRPKLSKAPDDAAIRIIIREGLPPDMPGAWQLHPTEVAALAAYVRSLGTVAPETLPGDKGRGARLYQSKGCAGCHIVAGKGEGFGPELSDIGVRRSAAYLRQTILKPSANLPEGFQYIAATPASGSAVRGIRVNEDSFTIQLKAAGGRFFSFRKAELKDLRRLEKETPMPAYEGQLTPAEVDDLVSYLASLKEKP
ncbi:MAG TPA: c-type cytochrome [Bryobacteraceae bacterium]|nr:c-type cytochrome [Bryobacteraceae bacterium]